MSKQQKGNMMVEERKKKMFLGGVKTFLVQVIKKLNIVFGRSYIFCDFIISIESPIMENLFISRLKSHL